MSAFINQFMQKDNKKTHLFSRVEAWRREVGLDLGDSFVGAAIGEFL